MDVHCLFFQPRDDFQGRFESSVAVLPETLGYPLPYTPCFNKVWGKERGLTTSSEVVRRARP